MALKRAAEAEEGQEALQAEVLRLSLSGDRGVDASGFDVVRARDAASRMLSLQRQVSTRRRFPVIA